MSLLATFKTLNLFLWFCFMSVVLLIIICIFIIFFLLIMSRFSHVLVGFVFMGMR